MNFQRAMTLAHRAIVESELSDIDDDTPDLTIRIKSRISKPNPKYLSDSNDDNLAMNNINQTKARFTIPNFPELPGAFHKIFINFTNIILTILLMFYI